MKFTKITLFAAFSNEPELPLLAEGFAAQLRDAGAATAACEWEEAAAPPQFTEDTDHDVLVDAVTARWPEAK